MSEAPDSESASNVCVPPIGLDALVRDGKKLLNSDGKGMTDANRQAFSLFLRAAESGHAEAQSILGWCYGQGDGVAVDNTEARRWLQQSAEAGFVPAMIRLAIFCQRLANSDEEATKWYRKAAEAGNTAACCILAGIYKDRNNHAEELRWIKMGALQGEVDCYYSVGRAYENTDTVTADPIEAYAWLKLVAATVGCYGKHQRQVVELESNLSPSAIEEGNRRYRQYTEEVSGWIRKDAERGATEAQRRIGWCYEKGIGVPQDFAEAVRWYQKAAEQGCADAQQHLAKCYERGQGVPQDYAESFFWLFKAAKQGRASAQFSIGDYYLEGRGVREDYAEAAKWFRQAAEQGHAEAQHSLANCYFKGWGVPEDHAEGLKWLSKAAEQGLAIADKELLLRRSITSIPATVPTAPTTPAVPAVPATPLTVERALAIVEHAENQFASGQHIEDAFTPFAAGGASTRLEALNALYIVIADHFRLSSARPSGASGGMDLFDRYANASQSIALRIVYDDNPSTLKPAAGLQGTETIESFVAYLRTLDPRGPDFWPQVYQRLGLNYPSEREEPPKQALENIGVNDTIKFPCPHCQQRLSSEPDLFGQEMPCPACGQNLTVPKPPFDLLFIKSVGKPVLRAAVKIIREGVEAGKLARDVINDAVAYVKSALPSVDEKKLNELFESLIEKNESAEKKARPVEPAELALLAEPPRLPQNGSTERLPPSAAANGGISNRLKLLPLSRVARFLRATRSFIDRVVTKEAVAALTVLLLLASWFYPPGFLSAGRFSQRGWFFLFDTQSKMQVDFGRLILFDAIIATVGWLLAWYSSRSGGARLAVALALIGVPACVLATYFAHGFLVSYWADKWRAEEAARVEKLKVPPTELKKILLFDVTGGGYSYWEIHGRIRNGLARGIRSIKCKAMFFTSKGELIDVEPFDATPVNWRNEVAEPGIPLAFHTSSIPVGGLPKDFTWRVEVVEAHYVP